MVTVIGSTTPTARKAHHCDSCGRDIEPGTTYHRSRCVDGGEAWTWKSHPACKKAGEILWDHGVIGDEDSLINVCDMDAEDRAMVYAADPSTYHAVWPNRPAPGQPTQVKPAKDAPISDQYKHCNHHHDLTDRHEQVTIGGDTFIANVEAIPLLHALNDVGLRTRTHHISDDSDDCFVSILLDNAAVEIREVNEIHADRTKYNGRFEVLIRWSKAP